MKISNFKLGNNWNREGYQMTLFVYKVGLWWTVAQNKGQD